MWGRQRSAATLGRWATLPIRKSVAVKFDLWNNQGEGKDSTGLYINGATPTVPAVDMTGSGVDLHSGHVFNVHVTYDGTALAMTITDASTQQSFTTSWTIDIPGTVGGTTAYVGFTGGTGSAIQEILNWTFVPGIVINYGNGHQRKWNSAEWLGDAKWFAPATDRFGAVGSGQRMVLDQGEYPVLHPGLQFPDERCLR